MQLVVLGVHRSGTSALTRLINMMGVYTGAEGTNVGFSDENRKGFWERHDVIALNDAILENYHCRWDDLMHWDTAFAQPLPEALQHRIKQMIHELDHHRPWVVKDPRMCQTFGHWKTHLEMPLAVIVWRDPIEVALSLHTRGISYQHGLAIWEHSVRHLLASTQGMKRIFIAHNDILQQPYAIAQTIYDWLTTHSVHGIHMPSQQEVTAFIDPALHRAKHSNAPNIVLHPEIELLKNWLQQPQADAPDVQASFYSTQALEAAHAHRMISEQRDEHKQFSQQQAEQIRALEQSEQIQLTQIHALQAEIQALQAKPAWQLNEADWLALLTRINDFEAEARGAIEHVKYSGLIGRLRLFLKKLLG